MDICKVCEKYKYKNTLSLSTHLKIHNLMLLEYFIKYENFKIPKCKYCDDGCDIRCGLKFKKICKNESCKLKLRKSATTSEKTREILRQKRFEYLKRRTGLSAWERRNKGLMSYLERWFFDNVIIKYSLLEKYDIVNEYALYPYFIDFAFINIKLAVELDGKCHFVNGDSRLDHDIKKENFLIENGWKIFRIRYDESNLIKINEFLNYLTNFYSQPKVLKSELYKYSIVSKIKLPKMHKQEYSKTCEECSKTFLTSNKHARFCCAPCFSKSRRKVERPSKELLLELLQKSSYVGIAKMYDVCDGSIKKWAKLYKIVD